MFNILILFAFYVLQIILRCKHFFLGVIWIWWLVIIDYGMVGCVLFWGCLLYYGFLMLV